ncbi:MAG: IPT/TIG domain-containing protein, partial [Candidatus Limnocylindrales bacterium]
LSTPIKMAQWYLDHYGRPGVTQGIILETDGHPQVGFEGGDQTTTNSAYTCQAAIDAATAAKADYTNSPLGIQIFTIGYGVDSTSKCPTYTSTRTDSSSSKNMYESATWSGVQAKIMLKAMATNPSYFFDDPPSSDLADAFTQAAQILANTKDHLIQLYPLPVVTSAGGPVTSVTIGGQYFTGASNVNFGPVSAQILSVTDTSITAKVPAGPHGSIVDVTVRTPAGLSVVTTADQYTYP